MLIISSIIETMKLIHNITISVFVKEFDDEEKTAMTLVSLLPDKFEEEKIKIEEETVKIEEGTKMKIFKAKTDKDRHNKQIISKIKDILGEKQCEEIAKDNSRIDDQGNLYIRLDKIKLEEKGEAIDVDHGECYHIKIMLAAFPKTKEKAILVAKKIFT
jgi:RNA binding exosome subunit